MTNHFFCCCLIYDAGSFSFVVAVSMMSVRTFDAGLIIWLLPVAFYFKCGKLTVPQTSPTIIHTLKSDRCGVKLVTDDHHVYQIEKYNEKTYWKCELEQCRARVHALLQDKEIIICKSTGEDCHPANPMKPKVYEAKSKMKILSINSQNASRKVMFH